MVSAWNNIQDPEVILNEMTKRQCTEMKAFSNPPPLLKKVLEAVAILLVKPTEWRSCQRMMQPEAEFIKQLKGFNRDKVT